MSCFGSRLRRNRASRHRDDGCAVGSPRLVNSSKRMGIPRRSCDSSQQADRVGLITAHGSTFVQRARSPKIWGMRHYQDLLSRDRNAGAHRRRSSSLPHLRNRANRQNKRIWIISLVQGSPSWLIPAGMPVSRVGFKRSYHTVSDLKKFVSHLRITYTQKGLINTCQKSTDHVAALLHSARESVQRAQSRSTNRGQSTRVHRSCRVLPDIKWV